MIRGIHHVAVNCRDIDRMIRFYQDAFGFEQVDSFGWEDGPEIRQLIDVKGSAARGVIMKAGPCYMELFQYSAPTPTSPDPKRPHDRGYTHFCIDVTDMEKDMAHLRKCGMEFTGRDFVDYGAIQTIYGYDPEGNVIEIQQCAEEVTFTLEKLD